MISQRVVIAGGGLTGLTTAYYLQEQALMAGAPLEILVVEPGRLGGKTQTEHIGDVVVEQAPDSFVAHKPWLKQLCVELGIPLVGANPAVKKTYIYSNGQMEPLPQGLQLMIPAKFMPFMQSRLLSSQGKLRALMEPRVPMRQSLEDESIGHFVRRRFGTEMLERIAGPLMGGIYGGDYNQVSMQATFPQYMKVEREQGSLLKWARRTASTRGTTGSAFQTVSNGLHTIIEKLLAATPKVRYLTGCAVTAVSRTDATYTVTLSNGEQVEAAAVVLAVPAYVSAGLVAGEAPNVAAGLQSITYTNSVVVALVYNRADVDHPLDATGFLVPKNVAMELTASTWVSSKWEHAAPPDKVLLRGFLGRVGGKDWTLESDEAAVAEVLKGLEQTMGIKALPVESRVFRWPRANAQYKVGHLDRVAAMDRELGERAPGLLLAGAAYRGVGLPDCVREGMTAATRVASHLGW